ncbi:MAG: metal ABC transporter substrate-binding protein [Magnetovibrionaceae bacterium]
MRRFLLSLSFILAPLTLSLSALPGEAEAKSKVVASFSILGDMVEQVAGDLAEVETIVGPNADAHVYTPSVADALAVTKAELIFVNGLGFETWSDTLIKTSGTKAKVIVATKGVEPLEVDGKIDPHAWNALTNGLIYVDNIAKALAEHDPANAATYEQNAAAFSAQLSALHEKTKAKLAALPQDRKTVVTAHDAFGYLANAYDLTFLAPVGIDTEAEPSAREMASLIDQIKSKGVAALFVENITNPALVEQIASETGLEIGGRLFSDALSVKGGPATSYYSMFEHNLSVLVEQLNPGS